MEVFEVNGCLDKSTLVHDHGDGCEDLSFCNATCNSRVPEGPGFAVIREPCDRFRSAAMQLAGELERTHPLGSIFWPAAAGGAQLDDAGVTEALLEYYEKSGCGNNTDPACLVRFAVRESRQWGARWEPRVLLFPQAFYVNSDFNIICHSQTGMLKAVMEGLTKATGCDMPAAEKLSIRRNERHYTSKKRLAPDLCRRVREVMACDAALFDRHCPGG